MITIERTTLRPDFVKALVADASAADLITQFDATSAANIPLDPRKPRPNVAAASYCDGNLPFPWRDTVTRFPWLAKIDRVVSIGSRATTIARICDMEPGNPLDPAQVAAWVVDMRHHKVFLPGGYTDRSEMGGLQQALANTKLPRHEYSIWLAAPGISVAEAQQLLKTFDVVQIAFDHTYDVSLARPSFYPPLSVPSPVPPAKAKGKLHFAGYVDFDKGQWKVRRRLVNFAHKGATSERWSAELQVGNKDLRVHIRELPFNSPPKGK